MQANPLQSELPEKGIPRLKSMLASLAVGSVRRELAVTPPGELAVLLEQEPELAFSIDYYFNLFEPELGATFLNHPEFHTDRLIDLFSCRIVAYHGMRLGTAAEDYKNDFFSGYWTRLNPDRLGKLVKGLLAEGTANGFPLLMLLGRRDPADLLYLQENDFLTDAAALGLFRSAGENVFDFITNNLNLYDYLQRLAVKAEDADYLEMLNGYFNIIVNLRVAVDFIDDCMRLKGADGRIPLKELVTKVSHIPEESQEYTLHLLEDRGMIEAGTLRAALDLN